MRSLSIILSDSIQESYKFIAIKNEFLMEICI